MLKPTLYAGKKRSRPHLKLKASLEDGSKKTNSSKRHRDKLNVEVEQLASLLPMSSCVSSRLDKLSVMRLTVSFLRLKSYMSRTIPSIQDKGTPLEVEVPEGDLMLKALNGFVLIVKDDGTILYTSQNIHEHLGYEQSDLISQSVFDLIHTEDRGKFTRQLSEEGPLHITSPGDECDVNVDSHATQHRSFFCRMRCLLDPTSGFQLMQIQGRLKQVPYEWEETEEMEEWVPEHVALFAIAVPVKPLSIIEIRSRSLIFRSKHNLDFRPICLDNKGFGVLGWSDLEYQAQSGYFYIHQDDLKYCAENHMTIIKTGELGTRVHRLLSKNKGWVWVSGTARLVYKDNLPDFIICNIRVLSEAEGEEHFRRRHQESRFQMNNQSYLYRINDLQNSNPRLQCSPGTSEKNVELKPGSAPQLCPHIPSDIWELLGHYELSQDDLEVIQKDQHICSLSPAELPDPLTMLPLTDSPQHANHPSGSPHTLTR